MAYGIVKYPLKNDEPNTFDAGPDEGGLSAPKPASDLKNNALRVVAVSLQENAGFKRYFASVASVPFYEPRRAALSYHDRHHDCLASLP